MKDHEFKSLTKNLFSTPEGKLWLREIKKHPQIQYFQPSFRQSTEAQFSCAYFDGTKQVIRMIDESLFE